MGIGIYYNKKGLKDFLIVKTSNEVATSVLNNPEIVIFKDKDKLIGFNIPNLSSKFSLKEGYLILSPELKKFVDTKFSIDLSHYSNNDSFIVGKITATSKIANSAATLCEVDIGSKKLTIVCGASNAKVGIITVVAQVGSLMPNGSLIQEGKVFDVVSSGMLCSQKDLGIDDISSGIIELDNSYFEGTYYIKHFSNSSEFKI